MSNTDYAKHLVKEHLRERTRSIFSYLPENVIESHIEAAAAQLVVGLLIESTVLMSGALKNNVLVVYKAGEI